jgi:hypothetical protein
MLSDLPANLSDILQNITRSPKGCLPHFHWCGKDSFGNQVVNLRLGDRKKRLDLTETEKVRNFKRERRGTGFHRP